ncbi:MAG: ribonucleoside-diphosphate reductase, partial [Phototrophicales bacterium]
WASAEPGVWFRERTNKMSNSWYFNPLIATNPCVTGDMRIYTDKGLIPARELFDDETDINVVIDGRFGVESTTVPSTRVFMTGTKQVYRLQTKEGYYLRATADHRVMTPRGWVELQDLEPGDKIHILNRKGAFGTEGSLELGRVLGWLVGDGTIKSNEAVLSFFGEEKRELAPIFAQYVNDMVEPLTVGSRGVYNVGVVQIKDRDEARIGSTRLYRLIEPYGFADNKHQVPEVVFRGTEDMQRGYLQALFTADGSFQDGGPKGGSIRLASNYLDLLEDVQILLGNFGIASRIYRNRRTAGYRDMPDGSSGLKSYWCEAQHELVISKQNMVVFVDEIGFLVGYKQLALHDYVTRGKRGPYAEHFTATVEDVIEDGIEDVFDLTEPITHSMIVNSLVLHQCGEQPLSSWSVCNLGAINLSKFYDAEANDVDWE